MSPWEIVYKIMCVRAVSFYRILKKSSGLKNKPDRLGWDSVLSPLFPVLPLPSPSSAPKSSAWYDRYSNTSYATDPVFCSGPFLLTTLPPKWRCRESDEFFKALFSATHMQELPQHSSRAQPFTLLHFTASHCERANKTSSAPSSQETKHLLVLARRAQSSPAEKEMPSTA